MIKRVCLYSGPGNGKSSLMANIFFELKKQHYNVEMATEFVKYWAYQNYRITDYDQFYAFSKQLRREEMFLRHGVDLVISDSPIYLQCLYSEKHKTLFKEQEWDIANKYEDEYPALNLFLTRDVPYATLGRYQTLEEAVKIDNEFIEILKRKGVWQLRQFKLISRAVVLDEIRKHI